MRRHHDMGGLEAGPIERTEHATAAWEKRVTAILRLLTSREIALMTVDELRRGIEDLGPGNYDSLGYFERWTASIANRMIEKGVFTVDELGRRMAEVEADMKREAAE
jgi:hypothetical protein